jgi:rhodanese-related sulfurtransferase
MIAAFGVYLAWKSVRRQRIARQFGIDRVSVNDLRRKLESGDEVAVVDLRHPIDFESDRYMIPHAVYIPAEELGRRQLEIPRDRDIALCCTCPNEITSAREALRLRAHGILRVRPLEGGFAAWRSRHLPADFVGPLVPPERRILNAA